MIWAQKMQEGPGVPCRSGSRARPGSVLPMSTLKGSRLPGPSPKIHFKESSLLGNSPNPPLLYIQTKTQMTHPRSRGKSDRAISDQTQGSLGVSTGGQVSVYQTLRRKGFSTDSSKDRERAQRHPGDNGGHLWR